MDKKILEFINNASPEELAKAIQEFHGIHGIRAIKDLWTDGEMHENPTVDETKSGPTMHSSGSGATAAINNYSSAAKQVGLVEQYKELVMSNLESWGPALKSIPTLVEKFDTGFGAMIAALDRMEKSLALRKDPDPKEDKEEEKEEMKKDPDPDPKKEEMHKDPDPKHEEESKACSDPSELWESLAELEMAYAKAEEHEHEGHDEKKDIEGLKDAKDAIEKAEHHIEEVEEHEKEEQSKKAAIKAQVAINLGWKALLKASKLGGYGLHGYGNQADEQISGDSTSDNSKHDLKKAEAKASYYTSKANRIRKANGMKPLRKDPDPEPDPKHEEKHEEMKKDPEPDPKHEENKEEMKAELSQAKADLTKMFNERIDEINNRMSAVSNQKLPPMTPIMIKSAGLSGEDGAQQIFARIDQAYDNGSLNEDDMQQARSLTYQYVKVGKGDVLASAVNSRLDHASINVQNFFKEISQSA